MTYRKPLCYGMKLTVMYQVGQRNLPSCLLGYLIRAHKLVHCTQSPSYVFLIKKIVKILCWTWNSLQLSYSKIISFSYTWKIIMVKIVNVFVFNHNKYMYQLFIFSSNGQHGQLYIVHSLLFQTHAHQRTPNRCSVVFCKYTKLDLQPK